MIYFGVLWVLCFFANTESFDRQLAFQFLEAFREVMTGKSEALHLLFNPNSWTEVLALDLLYHPFLLKRFETCAEALKLSALQALLLTPLFLALLGIYVYRSRQGQGPRFTGDMPLHAEEGGQNRDQSHKACACQQADQISIHPQRAMRAEREDRAVACEDPDQSCASAVASKSCQAGEKAAVFKGSELSVMKPEKA